MVRIFEIAAITGVLGFVGYYAWRSAREGRVNTGLALAVACFSLAWMEGPFDWVLYAQFNPDFLRAPDWGPFGMAHGGLPAVAPGAYVLYWFPPTLLAVATANRLIQRRGWRQGPTYLVTGFAVGFVFDVLVETVGTRLDLWGFGRGISGLTLYPGSTHQVPLTMSMLGAFMTSAFAYTMGCRDDRGRDVFQAWAQRRRPNGSTLLSLGATVVVMQLLLIAAWVPLYLAKRAGAADTVVADHLFDNVPNQPR